MSLTTIHPVPETELTTYFAQRKVQETQYAEWAESQQVSDGARLNAADPVHLPLVQARRRYQDNIRDLERQAEAETHKSFNRLYLPLPYEVGILHEVTLDFASVQDYVSYMEYLQHDFDKLYDVIKLYTSELDDRYALCQYYEQLLQGRVDDLARQHSAKFNTMLVSPHVKLGEYRWMMPREFPFDPTGLSGKNTVRETIVLSDSNRNEFNFIIPRYAPFFVDSLRITRKKANGERVDLVVNEDFYTGGQFGRVSEFTMDGKLVAGTIIFDDSHINGEFELQYQTLGGQFILDNARYAEVLASNLPTPYMIDWLSIVGKPIEMPTDPHQLDASYLRGFEDIIPIFNQTNTILSGFLTQEQSDERQQVYTRLTESANRLADRSVKLQEKWDKTSEQVNHRMQEIEDQFNNLASNIRNDVTTLIQQGNQNADQKFNDAITTINANLDSRLSTLSSELRNDYTNQINTLSNTVTQQNQEMVNDLLTKYYKKAEVDGFITNIKTVDTPTKISTALQPVNEKLGNHETRITELERIPTTVIANEQAISSLRDAYAQDKARLEKAISSSGQEASSGLTNIQTSLSQLTTTVDGKVDKSDNNWVKYNRRPSGQEETFGNKKNILAGAFWVEDSIIHRDSFTYQQLTWQNGQVNPRKMATDITGILLKNKDNSSLTLAADDVAIKLEDSTYYSVRRLYEGFTTLHNQMSALGGLPSTNDYRGHLARINDDGLMNGLTTLSFLNTDTPNQNDPTIKYDSSDAKFIFSRGITTPSLTLHTSEGDIDVVNNFKDINTKMEAVTRTIGTTIHDGIDSLRTELNALKASLAAKKDRVQTETDWGDAQRMRNKAPLTSSTGETWLGNKVYLYDNNVRRDENTAAQPQGRYTHLGYYWDAGLNAVGVQTDGVIRAVNVICTSDRRLKDDIQPIEDAATLIRKIPGYKYRLKETNTVSYGVLAQDVLKVAPEAVSINAKGEYGVDYNALTGILLEAVRQQQQQIDALNNQVQTLLLALKGTQ